MTNELTLIPGQLTFKAIQSQLKKQKKLILSPSSFSLIANSQQLIQEIVHSKKIVYGVNTGFGSLANQIISIDQLKNLQRNIVLSHACGVGELLSDELVSLVLLLKINSLSQGYSGVRHALIEQLIQLYNVKMFPCIPRQGSVGASGDLAPLAHLALPLIGEGEVRYKGKIINSKEGLAIANLKPLILEAKEGLALLNGLQVSTAICIKALL